MDEKQLIDLLNSYPEHKARLASEMGTYALRRQVRVFLFRIVWSAVTLLGIVLIFLLLERTPLQSEFVRRLSSGILYASIAFLGFEILRSLIVTPRAIHLAKEIETALPDLKSSLVTATEFVGLSHPPAGTSSALVKLTVSSATAQISQEKFRPALKRFSPRKGGVVAVFLLVILMVWYNISSFEVRRGINRLFRPFAALSPYSPLEFAVGPGNKTVARGESVQITAIPNQDIRHNPVLTLFKDGAIEGAVTEMYPDDAASASKYVFPLTGLQESTEYQVSHEKFVSERFSITVLPRPDLKSLELTVQLPAYLGLPPQKFPENVGECSILNGSKISLMVKATQKLATGSFLFEPSASCTTELKGDILKAEFSPATSTRYSIMIENEQGLHNENPVRYQITVAEDAAPTVAILKPGVDLPFPQSKRLDLKVAAKDDYGVVSVVLYYSIGNRHDWIPLNMKSDFSPKKEFEVDYPWLLDTLMVQPGTEINYNVRVEDGMKPTPQVASTPIFKVSMPSMYDVYRGADSAHQEVQDRLKEYLDDQKLQKESLSKAFEEIKHEGKLDYETEKQLEKAVQEKQESRKNAQEILDQVKGLQEKMETNPFSNPENLDKMQKLHELLDSVLDDEAKKLMKQLQEAMKDLKVDPKEIEKFEEAFKMDDYVKNLDRSIELLEQLREQMKMNSLGEALEDLKRRQEHIASETAALEEKSKNGALPPQDQAKLEDLKKEMDRLSEKYRQNMEELASEAAALEQKSQKSPMTPEEKARLSDLQKQMDQLQKELQDAKNRISSETAQLESRDKSGKLSPEDESRLNDLRKQQEKVKDEMEKLKKQAEEVAAKKTPEGEQEHPAKEDVKNLRDKFKQEDFKKAMEDIDKNLKDKNLSEAQKGQQKMLRFLETLAKDGKKIRQSSSGGGQQAQMDLSRFIRKALNVSHDQEKLLFQLDDLPPQFMRGQKPAVEGRIDECSVLELIVKRQAQDLEDALETFVRSSFSVNPDILAPLQGVQGIFSEIVKELEDRAIEKSMNNQREIIRRFNLLAMELMKAQDQSNDGGSSSDPKNALQQFKQLTQRQLSLYQQSQKNQMSPANQKLMEELKRMAMEQRKVREGLERVARESKQQRQMLGRMDDVMKDMQDLETKILDPNLRREVAEKQKSIYDRMLRAQKSIRNRDEEKEERKAEKARELIQVNHEKPLPSAGSETRDLSKDYLTELKEEFPRAYETEINDYYKSLNLYGTQENQ